MKKNFKNGIRLNMESNRKRGIGFEYELCELLAKHGWWSHDMAQNQTGQPADIIAVKNNTAILIDCKVCYRVNFPLSRVEPNQEAAMKHWAKCNNAFAFFALKMPDGSIYMIPDRMVWYFMEQGYASISQDNIYEFSYDIETWLNLYEGES